MGVDDMLKVKYDGIRPAPGYPTQPDHTEKPFMWKLLNAEAETGITLTDSHAMLPAASVSAVVFANKCSTYFQAGKLCKDQITDYANARVRPSRRPKNGLARTLHMTQMKHESGSPRLRP